MAIFEIFGLTAYWDDTAGDPFINTSFPVTQDDRLSDIIKTEVLRHDASRTNIDFVQDIKSAKSNGGRDATRLLELPISIFFKEIKAESPKQLTVVIDKPAPPSSVAARANTPTMFETLKARAKPDYKDFTSKFDVESVKKFQDGYRTASNKGTYLSTYGKNKPNIDEQIKTMLVDFLNKERIQFKGGTGGEDDRAKDGLKKVGGKNGPSEDDLEKLEEKLESSGYRCGMDINSGKLYARQAVLCGHPIEAEYYNPKTGTKGGRIVTTDICAICYIDDDLVAPNEISKAKKVGGKTPLTMCRGCFDSDVEPPCSGKRTNTKQATQQKNSANKRKMDNAVKSGRRKARKGS